MAINPSIGLVGVAVQDDRDTPASTPTFLHGLTGGAPFGAPRSVENTPVACGNRGPSDARIGNIDISPSVQTLCYPDVIGLYLYAALGSVSSSADSVAGEGYYKHVFKMGPTLPYLTVWSQVGVGNFTRSDGCKVSQLQLSATGNEHLAAQVDLLGIAAEIGIDAIPGSLDPSCYGGKYTTTDCTFKLDTASDTPVDALVADATFTLSNSVSGLTSLGRVTPRDIADGNLSAGVSVTTIPDDITQYQQMMTGSASETHITGKVVLGSVYAKFKSSDDEKMTIEIEYDHVPFTADYVSVEPEGSEGTIQFTADAAIITAADESPVTITLVNKTPSYTS